MAVEPITRQEQIIAGKDLEPITRMEKFLKEYGGASSPKLLGEIVLTNENCALSPSGEYLSYDNELQQQVQAILDACKTKAAAPTLRVNIADFQGVFSASYYSKSATLNSNEAIQFSLDIGGHGQVSIKVFGTDLIGPSFLMSAILGGYPMTVKVYAT